MTEVINYKNLGIIFKKLNIKLKKPRKQFYMWVYDHLNDLNIDTGILYWRYTSIPVLFFSEEGIEVPHSSNTNLLTDDISNYLKYCINWPKTSFEWTDIIRENINDGSDGNAIINDLLKFVVPKNNLQKFYNLKYDLKWGELYEPARYSYREWTRYIIKRNEKYVLLIADQTCGDYSCFEWRKQLEDFIDFKNINDNISNKCWHEELNILLDILDFLSTSNKSMSEYGIR